MVVGGTCCIDGCKRTTMYNKSVCYKHRELGLPIVEATPKTDVSIQKEDGAAYSVFRYDIDGKKRTIDSKAIDQLFPLLKEAKKFWIVDLGLDEDEFVQYAIKKGELEHWDNKEMIESRAMPIEDAFEVLQAKLMGDFTGHTVWWGDEVEAEEEAELDTKNGKGGIVVLGGIIILLLVLFYGGDELANLPSHVGEMLCQGCFGLAALGGAGALGRTDSGKFKE